MPRLPDARGRRHALQLTAVLWLGLCGCDATLYESLPRAEAKRVVDLLGRAGIAAELSPSRSAGSSAQYGVAVSTTEVHRALAELQRDPLGATPPQPGFQEVYGGAGLVPTPTEERAREAAAAAGEIAATLQQHAMVQRARVHLSPLAPAGQLDEEAAGRSALAWVILSSEAQPGVVSERWVARTVAASVVGLDASAVVVQLHPARELPSAPQPQFVQVGPLAVASASLPTLRIVLGGSLLLNGLLAAGVALLWRRRKLAS